MFKLLGIILFYFSLSLAMAKDISVEVLANKEELTADVNEDMLLQLNGFRQAVTRELEELKLDSALYWSKLESKKMSLKDEQLFLKTFFTNETVARPAPQDPTQALPLKGTFSASIDIEKLKASYEELANDLADTKLKTFYLLTTIELDKSMTWEDLGLTKAESFSGVILDSWKTLITKEMKGFERVVVLDKDFTNKPDYMNSKSVTLKWNSVIKKVGSGSDTQKASYEINAQYVLQKTKSGTVVTSLDFPVQKRSFDHKNAKALSSNLASLIYSLLLSQVSKIQGHLDTDAQALEMSEVEVTLNGKVGLSEIFQINSYLQEKFKDLKLTSQMKSYTGENAKILIRAQASVEAILDSLSKEGGKFPLNEQKVLHFNRSDKTFAILPKESNN